MPKRLGQHQAPSGAWIRTNRRLAIYIRDGFRCLACYKDLRDAKPADVTLDHLLSKSEHAGLDEETREAFGSVHANHNIVTSCRSCNSTRRDMPWTAFYDTAGQARVLAARDRALNMELANAILAGKAGDPRLESERGE